MKKADNAPFDLMKFLRFACVGGAFSIAYAVSTALIINRTKIDPFIVSISIFIICIPLAFRAQQHFSFRAENLRPSAFWIYTATQVGSLAIVSSVTTRYVTYNFAMDTLIMGATVGATAVASFFIGALLTFRPPA